MNAEISILLRRHHKPPAKLGGFVITTDNNTSYEEIINFCLIADCSSLCFKEAFENKRWAQALNGEMNAIRGVKMRAQFSSKWKESNWCQVGL